MDQITLGQVAISVTFIVGLIGGIGYLKTHIEDWFKKPLKEEIAPIKKRMDEIDMNATKNFLVRCIKDIERGVDLSDVEYARFWEQYDHYDENGGNSYIKASVNMLIQSGVLIRPPKIESEGKL